MNTVQGTSPYSRGALYANLIILLLELLALFSFLLLPWAEANLSLVSISGTGLQVAFNINDLMTVSSSILDLGLPVEAARMFYPLVAIPILLGIAIVITLFSLTLPKLNVPLILLVTAFCYLGAVLAFYWVTAFQSLGIQLVGFTGMGFWLMVMLSLLVPIPAIVQIRVENMQHYNSVSASRLPPEEPIPYKVAPPQPVPHPQAPPTVIPVWILYDKGNGQQYQLNEGHNSIGRSQSNKIVLASAKVSREHALISINDGKVILYDRASAHGTFVNGQRVTRPTALESNSQLMFGDVLVTVTRQG
jgi:hypothetical protein